MKEFAVALIFATVAVTPAFADDCRHEAARRVEEPAAGARSIHVIGRAGSLTVVGVPGMSVRAHGTACTSDSDLLDQIQLKADRRGDRVVIEAVIPETTRWGIGSFYRRLDFTVEIPSGIHVEVEDGSGSLEVRSVASVDIEDGSGSISVRDVPGVVTIRDGSGSIEVRQAGMVRIDDGSGLIDVRGIRGDVIIEEDGSGGIDIADVGGNVVIERDGSGGIDVRNVTGSFEVGRDGSGGISHRDVRGRVSVPRD